MKYIRRKLNKYETEEYTTKSISLVIVFKFTFRFIIFGIFNGIFVVVVVVVGGGGGGCYVIVISFIGAAVFRIIISFFRMNSFGVTIIIIIIIIIYIITITIVIIVFVVNVRSLLLSLAVQYG